MVHRPKILFVTHTSQLSGGELALTNLLSKMDRNKFEPAVLLFAPGPLEERLNQLGIAVHRLYLSPDVLTVRRGEVPQKALLQPQLGLKTLLHVAKCVAFIQRERPDIIQCNSLKADIIAGAAGRLCGVPVIWHVRDRIAADYMGSTAATVFRRLAEVIPQYVIANSNNTLGLLRIPESRPSSVIYSGVVLEKWQAAASIQPRDKSVCRVGLVGRISPWKGQHVFIKAASLLRQSHPHCEFLIVGSSLFGETDYYNEMLRLIDELALKDKCKVVGFCDDMPTMMNSLDILVHCSTIGEPFGQVVVEAMAAGKPVVATNGGAIPELVQHEQTGLLVPMNDCEQLSQSIGRLADDPALRARLGEQGRSRAAELFSIERSVQQLGEVYSQILKK